MSWPNIDSVFTQFSGVENVDALLSPDHPTYNYQLPSLGNTITYSFVTSRATSDLPTTINYMNDTQKQYVRQALDYVRQETGINFSEVTAKGTYAQFFFGYSSSAASDVGYSDYWSYTAATSGDGQVDGLTIWDNILLSRQSKYMSLAPGTAGYEALLGGIGVALGLQKNPSFPNDAPTDDLSVMVGTTTGKKTTFGLRDSDALTWIYGNDGLGGTMYASTVSPASLNRQALIAYMTSLALAVGANH